MTARMTIYDIARLAGVSKSTVSRVLTNSSRVDKETVKRVRQVMEEHNYIPSLHASSLKGKNQFIGIVVPRLNWSMMPDIFLGVSDIIDESPYEVVLFTESNAPDYQEVIERLQVNRLVAGLLVVPNTPIPDDMVKLPQKGIPVVLMNLLGFPSLLPRVSSDNAGGVREAVRYLISLGHTRIAYIHGGSEFPCSQERYEGYCAALREANIEVTDTFYFPGSFDYIDGTHAIEAIVQMPVESRPTALFASNDIEAYGALKRAEELQLHIPEDLALIGFDDIPPSIYTRPALTTVKQPFQELGQCATDLLLSLLDPERPFPDRWHQQAVRIQPEPSSSMSLNIMDLRLPTPLVIRESAGNKIPSKSSNSPATLG
ncbi:LacI family transcriptional regulator [Dictyobacter alpinus]|uniref:LacI family transcriptional regulator n=1 Tax=Dictyobacter alpinus TaxID=2014873 RepID=A0A402B165_9CHLR|nr:LacI family DNA-binding transcriptional regulator [Dictyobacter alpinus]GCE25086.1 LacI family transcriptional regulator [Dictyobacter alpinus]